ncbi:hypothetical protein TRFO_22229 [Tritrichomonas foetus]|uniref:Uncharacterized protein n=1 Tax=Tritrichomonas foetus TaxID=1144522 RepID=A0A1J4KC47_9EUKA|nr:hypothetical protein TRFO_22229 [Tritrichomonas foetus]|eukprot:OHT08993.1 hypothetical protein TRFO_22229 [Tritrichomonas foetus]
MSGRSGNISTSVYCFGSGEFNQTTQQNDVNTPVLIMKDSGIEKVFAGGWHSATISVDGKLTTWGKINTVKTTDQTANLFEDNKDENSSKITTSTFNQEPTVEHSGVKNAALTDYHTIIIDLIDCAHLITYDNQIVTVPNATNIFAKYQTIIVFQGTKIRVYTPMKDIETSFELPQNENPISAAIINHGFAILSDKGILRIYNQKQPDPSIITDIVSVASSNEKYIVLKPNGRIYEIFSNGSKRQISGIGGNPIALFAGGSHFGCITFEGDCWMWGVGVRGQLGNSSFTNSFQPKKVVLKEDVRVISGAAGEEHTILLTVKDTSFIPQVPEAMKQTEYIKMLRMSAAIQGAFLASEFDSKF